jgi:hypothetical protein
VSRAARAAQLEAHMEAMNEANKSWLSKTMGH